MCGPEFSDLEGAIWQRYQDQDVVVLGINAGQDQVDDIEHFVEIFQISFPVLIDDAGVGFQYQQSGAVSPFPLDYVIDREGNVAYWATEYDPDAMTATIDALLASETATPDTPTARGPGLAVHPNPFNPRTTIHLDLPRAGPVTLDLHDPRGRRLRRLLADAPHPAGAHTLDLDAHDAQGRPLPSGVYMLVLRTEDHRVTRKVTLLR